MKTSIALLSSLLTPPDVELIHAPSSTRIKRVLVNGCKLLFMITKISGDISPALIKIVLRPREEGRTPGYSGRRIYNRCRPSAPHHSN